MPVQPDPISVPGDPDARVAVVDIGSNSVRLVVYDAPMRLPVPVFNETALCGLGRGLDESGKLNADGVEQAMRSLDRYIRLAGAMGVGRLELMATAAVREAEDGPAFVARVEHQFGLPVSVLSGAEEARLAALGLLSGVPAADGLLGDLGGGSLDLIVLDHGDLGDHASLPLGHIRLAEAARHEPARAAAIVGDHLATVPWLEAIRGRDFFAIGGAWRAMARIFIAQSNYPLHVVDNYVVERGDALRLTRLIAALGPRSIEKISGIPRRRTETLSFASAVLLSLLERAAPRRLVFSGFGMREGKLLECLPENLRRQDPLISACTSFAERTGRFSLRGEEILDWMAPLFPGETAAEGRLRLAASLLSDIGWTEHPDYRAEHAFHRVLRLPFAGLAHDERVLIALAVYVRYNGDPKAAVVAPVRRLLHEDGRIRAQIIGLGLRLAHTLSGSAPGVLADTRLDVVGTNLTLTLPEAGEILASETVERRLATLARSKGLNALIV